MITSQKTRTYKLEIEKKDNLIQDCDVIIYTDGSCTPNPGKGGWSAILIQPQTGITKELTGGFNYTTVGRMEIIAALVALRTLSKDNLTIKLYSDAKYVVDSVMKKWVYSWETNNFLNRPNGDLWIELLKTIRRQKKVEFIWVKGHSGVKFNEICDILAKEASLVETLPDDIGYINPVILENNNLFSENKIMPISVEEAFLQEDIPDITPEEVNELGFKLRKYQKKSTDKMEVFLNNPKIDKGVFVLPTGAGKSIIIAELAQRFPNKYFVNVSTSKELIKQNYEKFISYGLEASLLSASLNKKETGKITFATVGTLISEVKFFKDKEVVIVFDEAHIASQKNSQFDLFIKQLRKVKTIGLTATPFRLSNTIMGSSLKMMNRDRNCMYKSIEEVVQVQEMIDGGYWSPLKYETHEVDESSLIFNSNGSDYTESSVDNFVDENNIAEKIVESVKKYKNIRKSILVSVPSIKKAEEIARLIPGSRALHSKMKSKERDQIVSDFKSGEIEVVIQVRILTVGFDHPELDCIIMGTPSNSLTFHYQLGGRGVRKHENKKDCLIIDYSGNTKRFGKIEDIKIINSTATKGWAVIGAEGRIMTGFMLNIAPKTLSELEERSELQKENVFMKKIPGFDAILTFGKYTGSTASQVVRDDFRYVKWLLENKKFTWNGESMLKIRESLIYYVEKFSKKLAD